MLNINFNSIKVRLEQVEQQVSNFDSEFQFHKGTIRTELTNKIRIDRKNFNTIKVLLEHDNITPLQGHHLLFQFHKGTIRTQVFYLSFIFLCEFQFHKGTIRT